MHMLKRWPQDFVFMPISPFIVFLTQGCKSTMDEQAASAIYAQRLDEEELSGCATQVRSSLRANLTFTLYLVSEQNGCPKQCLLWNSVFQRFILTFVTSRHDLLDENLWRQQSLFPSFSLTNLIRFPSLEDDWFEQQRENSTTAKPRTIFAVHDLEPVPVSIGFGIFEAK